ncbi:MAG TPA: hypothetical protein EYG18_08910 [Micavibrio sp.]|nr:hypothetical protein [Micavibrio sp.]HIL29376.1 hypothetical protein [Micavibrio sp.]
MEAQTELKLDNVQKFCREIAQEMQTYQKNLTIHFVIHHDGQRLDALSMAAQDILGHPAAETAMQFLQKPGRSELSTLLGTAVARENILLGLTTRDHFLALCALNIDHFASMSEARLHAYHLAWHVLDIIDYHRKDVDDSFHDNEVIFRERSAIDACYANLQADIFATSMCRFQKEAKAPQVMARLRGGAALERRTLQTPEHFPFAMCIDTVDALFEKVPFDRTPKKLRVNKALRMARQISLAYDIESLKQWATFCEPAQDMAWRGMSKERIISTALNTSSNTYVRAIGFTLKELLDIEPTPIEKIHDTYSPFADDLVNQKLHNKIVETICQDVIAQGVSQNSAMPMLKKANEQNTELTFGRTLGWCANALQAAAKAFDIAKKNNTDAYSAARQEFIGQKQQVSWESIDDIGRNVMMKQRSGKTVTLSDIRNLTEGVKGMEKLHASIDKTINDPSYQHKLAAASELENTKGLQPIGLAPKAAAPRAAAYEVAPSGPALGGRPQKTVPPQQPPQKTEQQQSSQDEQTE